MSVRNISEISELLKRIQLAAKKIKEADQAKHVPFFKNVTELINEYFAMHNL